MLILMDAIEMGEVVSVFPNRYHKLHTTKSWDFIGLPQTARRHLKQESNITVGLLDTGIEFSFLTSIHSTLQCFNCLCLAQPILVVCVKTIEHGYCRDYTAVGEFRRQWPGSAAGQMEGDLWPLC